MGVPTNTNAVQEGVNEILARADGDPALRRRLKADPEGTIIAEGVALPGDVALVVRPNGDGVPHVTVQQR